MRLIYITDRTGTITVPESRAQISTLLACLTVVCAAALGRGLSAVHTAAGRIAVAVIFGGLLVVFIAGWIVAVRRPGRLEVSADTVRYVRRNGQASTLSRQDGDELRFVKERRGRIWRLGLAVAGTDTVMLLGTFSQKAVRQACVARGWRFVG